MTIIFLFFLCLCFYKVKFSGWFSFHKDYMSIEKTIAIKGIFVILVFFRHFRSYIKSNYLLDTAFLMLDKRLGQLIVTMFFFYSGFGVLESIKKKGEQYINKIPFDRMLKTLINFDIAVFLFLIVDLCLNHVYKIKTILLSFIGWESIGNSNWFIFTILITYLFTYICFIIFKDNKTKAVIGITVLSAAYLIIMFNIKDSWWYDTIFCYSAGMWFSLYKDKLEHFVLSNSLSYYATLVFTFFIFIIFYKIRKDIIFYEIFSLLFVCLIVLVTMKMSFNNVILKWLGKHIFSIYILQRIPMIIFKFKGMNSINIYSYFLLCLVSTLLLATIFTYIIDRLNIIFFKKTVKDKYWISKSL